MHIFSAPIFHFFSLFILIVYQFTRCLQTPKQYVPVEDDEITCASLTDKENLDKVLSKEAEEGSVLDAY